MKNWWGRTLRPADLASPATVSELFAIAVAADEADVTDCDQDRVAFFAFAIHCLRTVRTKPIGVFTTNLDGTAKTKYARPWRQRPSDADRVAASKQLRELDSASGGVLSEVAAGLLESADAAAGTSKDAQMDALRQWSAQRDGK